jgi:hypothetical protein
MLRLLPARRLIAACLVIWVLPCLDRQLPAQQKSEVTRARVEALLAIENRSAAIARFKTMGPEVVPALVAILEDAVAEDGESVQRFGGGMGGRHRARTLSDVARMMHPEQRPEALGVPLRFSGQPNRSRRDPDAVLGEWVVPIANDEQFLRSSSLELVAAYALGELPEWAVREMKALAPLVQRADMVLCQQLLHSLSKIGAPAVPLLLSVVDKEWGLAGWEALYALHHMGAAAQPGILRYLREVDPKKSSNKHAWLWAMLAKSGTRRRIARFSMSASDGSRRRSWASALSSPSSWPKPGPRNRSRSWSDCAQPTPTGALRSSRSRCARRRG